MPSPENLSGDLSVRFMITINNHWIFMRPPVCNDKIWHELSACDIKGLHKEKRVPNHSQVDIW